VSTQALRPPNPQSPSVASVTSVRCFPLPRVPARKPPVSTKLFVHRIPNPLRGLRDLRAMLSPLARSSTEAAGVHPGSSSTELPRFGPIGHREKADGVENADVLPLGLGSVFNLQVATRVRRGDDGGAGFIDVPQFPG
jgi:hypothetical protein